MVKGCRMCHVLAMLFHITSTLSAGANTSLWTMIGRNRHTHTDRRRFTHHFPDTKPCLVEMSLSFSDASRWI